MLGNGWHSSRPPSKLGVGQTAGAQCMWIDGRAVMDAGIDLNGLQAVLAENG